METTPENSAAPIEGVDVVTDPNDGSTWSPPKRGEGGVELAGEWPLNHRLRAEAMATAGVTTDPDGLIDDALIVDAGERLAADAKAAKANQPKSPSRMSRAELDAEMARLEITAPEEATNPERAKLIEAARAENKE